MKKKARTPRPKPQDPQVLRLKSKIEDLTIRLRHIENDCAMVEEEHKNTVLKYLDSLSELQRNNDELEELKTHLEERVNERTSLFNAATRRLENEVNERKKAQSTLLEEKEKWRNLFEQSPIGIEVYNAEGVLTDINTVCLIIFGARREDLLGRFRLLDDPNLPKLALSKLMSGQSVCYDRRFDFELVKQNNLYPTSRTGVCDLSVMITPLRDGERLLGYLVQVQDVTEPKRAEEERERLLKEVQEALAQVQALAGLLPICVSCKKIRDDKGYWTQVENYISSHTSATFTHGFCPECMKKNFPEVADDLNAKTVRLNLETYPQL